MKKILTIMALLVAFVTTGFADSYYIVGDLAGGWTYTPVADGNYLEMQLVEGSNTYFADITSLSGDKYFCLADGDGSDWGDFNGNHRYSANEVNYSVPTDGTSFQLGKNGDRSMKITGDGSNYHFVFNADTKMLTVTKNSDITNVALRGATDTEWQNQFNLSLTKQSDFVYTGTLDLTEATTDAYFKLVINGSSWIGYGALTLDTELPITAEHGNNGDNFKLAHSNGVYKTYTVTATWTEGTNVSTGWTLKIEGKDERVAEISSVLIHGALASDTQWANALTLPLTGSENVYSQTVPLTTTLQDLVFELQVNGQNVRYNDVTIDPESTTGLLVDGGGNEHFILFKNSISGYDTYLATATWTPNPDPKAGWTLKVVGVHERTLDYAIVGDLTGGWPATTDDDGSKDVSMTAQNNGLYTLVVDEFAAEANTTYEYKLRTNKMWNLFDLPGNGNASWTPTEAGNYKLTFVANVTGAAITDDTFGEIAAYTVTVVPEKIVEDYYVIGYNDTEWVALGKMEYNADMKEYYYNLDETWTGKYFAIAPASALNADGSVANWDKVLRPKSKSGNYLVELRQYYDDVVTGGNNVWEKADEITRLSIHYYINVQDFALYPESDVTISDAGYATYSNKYDYFTVDAKVSIVKNVEGNKAVLEELEFLDGENKGISGGTGVILEKVLDETDVVTIYPYEKYADNEYVDVTGNMLIGSGNSTYDITGNDTSVGDYKAYILANGANGVGFYPLASYTEDNQLAPHKAFLAVRKNQSATDFIGFGDTTGINNVERGALNVEGCYTLDGRRVENPTKGLYIINGKKVLVK